LLVNVSIVLLKSKPIGILKVMKNSYWLECLALLSQTVLS